MAISVEEKPVKLSQIKNRYNITTGAIRYQIQKNNIPMELGNDGKNYISQESIKILDDLYLKKAEEQESSTNTEEPPKILSVEPQEEIISESEKEEPKDITVTHEESPNEPQEEPFNPISNGRETMAAEEELRAKIDALREDWAGKKSDFTHQFEKVGEKTDALEDGYNRLLEQGAVSTKAIAGMTTMLESIKQDIDSNGKLSEEKLKAVDALKEDIPAVINEKLQPVQEKLEKIEEWTPERVREMVNDCIKDPESDACKLIGEMVKPAEEKPPVSELVEHGLSHNSGKELLECETCGPIVIQSLKEDHPEMLEKLLCDPEDNECRLNLKLLTEAEVQAKVAEAVAENEKEGKKGWI